MVGGGEVKVRLAALLGAVHRAVLRCPEPFPVATWLEVQNQRPFFCASHCRRWKLVALILTLLTHLHPNYICPV